MIKIKILSIIFLLTTVSHSEIFTLQNNEIIDGEITHYDSNTLVIQSFIGKEYSITWDMLHPICKEKLKYKFGMVQQEQKVELEEGVLLYLKTGGTVEGKLLLRNTKQVLIKNYNGEVPIPIDNIVKMEKKKIKITSIYTADEIYEGLVRKYNLNKAEDQFNLASLLLQVGAVSKAQQHINKAIELDARYADRAQKLLLKIEQNTEKESGQKTIQKFELYISSRRFADAENMLPELQEFLTKEQVEVYRAKITNAQTNILTKNIPGLWMDKMFSKITSLSLDRKIDLNQARSQLGDLEKQIIAEIAEKYSISEDKVTYYFQKREGKNYKASYKRGTFVIGLGNNKSKVDNIEKIEVILQKSSKNKVVKKTITPDEWWQSESSSRKKEWLQAYYFENHLGVEREEWDICPQCSANGFIKSGKVNITCPYCQGIKFQRTIIAK